jgi:hypothetical protein
LVRFFARSTSSTTPAMAVAAIGEVAGLGRVLPDHHALAAVSRITHTRVSLPCSSSGNTVLSATFPQPSAPIHPNHYSTTSLQLAFAEVP